MMTAAASAYAANPLSLDGSLLLLGNSTPDEGPFYAHADVARAPDGHFVVAWDDAVNVFAQIYNAAGSPVGTPISVDPETGADGAAVAMDAAGNFVVTWLHAADNNSGIVRARRFGSDGAALSGVIAVSPTVTLGNNAGIDLDASDSNRPALAMNAIGEFAVAWVGDGPQAGSPLIDQSIEVRRYTADGTPLDSSPLRVNRNSRDGDRRVPGTQPGEFNTIYVDERFPALALADNGDFAVGWRKLTTRGPQFVCCTPAFPWLLNSFTEQVIVRAYNGDGRAKTAALSAWSHSGTLYPLAKNPRFLPVLENAGPAVAIGADGRFAAAWVDYTAGVYTRFYSPAGFPATRSIEISTNSNAPITSAVLSDGRFVDIYMDAEDTVTAVWLAHSSSEADGKFFAGQRVAANGSLVGSGVNVGTLPVLDTEEAALAGSSDGAGIAVWIQREGSPSGLVGQRLAP
jgi:hypothetical protein